MTMSLDEAINCTKNIIATLPGTLSDREREALFLNIEALKVRQAFREKYGLENYILLPGETQE